MANDTLNQLEKIVASDEFDLKSGQMVKKLREKWELAEAAENLGEHLVIQNIVKDLKDEITSMMGTLQTQVVVTDEDKIVRFQMQADCKVYQRIVDLFSGDAKTAAGSEIDAAYHKANAQ